jgi:hypothetical protein
MAPIRGRKHLPSKNPDEQRTFLLRYSGKLHNDTIAHCTAKGISMNRYLIRLIEKDIYQLPEAPVRPFNPPPEPDDPPEDTIRL